MVAQVPSRPAAVSASRAVVRTAGASLAALIVVAWGLPHALGGHGLVVGANWRHRPIAWPRSLDTLEASTLVVIACVLVPQLASWKRKAAAAPAAVVGVVLFAMVVAISPSWLWARVSEIPTACAAELAAAGQSAPAERPWASVPLAALAACASVAGRSLPLDSSWKCRMAAALANALLILLAALVLWDYVDNWIVEPLLWHC